MDAVLLEEKKILTDDSPKKIYMSHEKVAEITKSLIEEHREALTALANA